MPQSQSTGLPKHKKEGEKENKKYKTNATYETTDAQTKKNCKRETWERSVDKLHLHCGEGV